MNDRKPLEDIITTLYSFISVLLALVMVGVVLDTFSLALDVAAYNIVLVLPLFSLMLMLLRKSHLAAIATAVAVFSLCYVDQYVFAARLTHVRFSDLRLAAQAMRVAGRYPLIWNAELGRRFVVCLTISAFLIFIYWYYKPQYQRKLLFCAGLSILLASIGVIVSGVMPSSTEDFDFTTDTEQRGLLYSWYCQARESRVTKPEGYTREAAQAILNNYTTTQATDHVNVIVIMNESLADYSLVGNPHFDDPLPFMHSLVASGEAVEGSLVVSVFGGGTATTEYEFLTGHSMAFLPDGTSPYLQYVGKPTDNLASELEGYNKTAIHPYYSEEWNRSQVYKFFGFDQFLSGKDFGSELVGNGGSATSRVPGNLISFGDGPLYVRGLISDRSDYEKVLSAAADKSFIFNVTMQNHGGYDYIGNDFTNGEYVTEADRLEWMGTRSLNGMLYSIDAASVEDELYKVNQYLTCSNLSDQAFEYLIESLKNSDENTIVLMFGDHQPGLLVSEHYVDVEDNVCLDYTVPFIIWSNYGMDFDVPAITSPNYLSAVLKKNAGLGLTAWDQFRLDQMEEFPVVTANFILDKKGEVVGADRLKDYEMVQYMRMFG